MLVACSGEPVPRDYQNAPPAVASPADEKKDTPTQHGMGEAAPQPSSGVEGTSAPYADSTAPDAQPTTMGDTPPTTTT